jgi:hypothetical protein
MYNPGISFVYAIAKKYHDALNSGKDGLPPSDVVQIKRMFEECVQNKQYLDYYSAKTYIVVEILSNILQRRLSMAMSLYGVLQFIYSAYEHLVTEPDIGRLRIEEFTLVEADEPCIDALKSEQATAIMIGLYDMGYRLHRDFLAHCSEEFRSIYYL